METCPIVSRAAKAELGTEKMSAPLKIRERRAIEERKLFLRKRLEERLSCVLLLTGAVQGVHPTREKVRRQRRNRGCDC